MSNNRKILLGVGVLILGLQLIPVNHSNPPIVKEPTWDSPRTRELAKKACFDCHSNETHYPWYSRIAPISFWLNNHIEEGREHLNFSDWTQRHSDADEVVEEIKEGEMPMKPYVIMHSEAKLSANEQNELIEGLRKTMQE